MSATNFKTENNTYRKLIGNGLTYRIPRFQRDYSWSEDEWEDLWLDIMGTIQESGEPAHYMGYLVLQSSDDKVFDVIDGQQRLTTMALIVISVLKNLKKLVESGSYPENNQQRMDQIRQTYIGYLDPVTLLSRSKLTLNRNNDNYFQNYIVPLGNLPVRGFRASEHNLRKAFEWFEKKVREYAKKMGGDEGVVLARLVEDMSDRLFFTTINVTDELNAYKVFETLNARGVKLSSTDLLKNCLFSVLHRENKDHPHEMDKLEERWEAMVSRLGNENFSAFLRVHWMSRRAFVRQAELFKKIRERVTNRSEVFELLRGMEEDMDTYLALAQPDASDWHPRMKDYARDLRMFSVRQPFALLVAAARKLPLTDLEKVLHSCVVISFRYNVIGGLPPNEQESLYFSIAQKITHGEYTKVSDILESLKSVYPSDDIFKASFAEKILNTTNSRNLHIVRYILCELEKQQSTIDHDVKSDSFNVEHVLPQNPEQGWESFTDEEVETNLYRLGNMALLNKKQNKNIGNVAFEVKKDAFMGSEFELTKKIARDNTNWTPKEIAARQKAMAKLATAVWRIPQLS